MFNVSIKFSYFFSSSNPDENQIILCIRIMLI